MLKELKQTDSIVRIIRMFMHKREDIGVAFGMQYMAAIFSAMFIVETDAFIMFCHVYENLYPSVINI